MSVYYVILICIGFCLILPYDVHIGNRRTAKAVLWFAAGAILVCVSGLRYNVGTDYGAYERNFWDYRSASLSNFSQLGLMLVAKVSSILASDPAPWFFLMAVVTIVPVIYLIYTESEYAEYAVILYLFLGCWHYSFNVVKQSASATVLFCGLRSLRDKRFWKWCVWCALAATFHVTALVMIPVYFLADLEVRKRNVVLTLVIGIIVQQSTGLLYQLAFFLKEGSGAVKATSSIFNRSVSIFRVAVNFSPMLLTYMVRRYCDFQDDDFRVLFNLSLINAAMNIGTMNSVYLYRVCIFTNIYNCLYIPRLLSRVPVRYRRWVTAGAFLAFFAFWSYDLYKGSTTSTFQWIFQRDVIW